MRGGRRSKCRSEVLDRFHYYFSNGFELLPFDTIERHVNLSSNYFNGTAKRQAQFRRTAALSPFPGTG
jgi:hypothetical protein